MRISKGIVVIFFLVVFIMFLFYRVLDMGISATYSEASMEATERLVNVLKTYQRRPCSNVDEYKGEYEVLRKNEDYIVGGFLFECRDEEGFDEEVFLYVEG
ncbi:MAG: hypothetical protein ACJATD_000451 [Alloalcanivorax sp.]|jgi:hypothetical protein